MPGAVRRGARRGRGQVDRLVGVSDVGSREDDGDRLDPGVVGEVDVEADLLRRGQRVDRARRDAQAREHRQLRVAHTQHREAPGAPREQVVGRVAALGHRLGVGVRALPVLRVVRVGSVGDPEVGVPVAAGRTLRDDGGAAVEAVDDGAADARQHGAGEVAVEAAEVA